MTEQIPAIAHIVTPYLFQTGSWIYTQIKSVDAFRPIVLTTKTENLDQYPVAPIYLYRPPFEGKSKLAVRASVALDRLFARREHFYIKSIKQENAALIHAHFGPQGWMNLGTRRKSGAPMITTFYGYDVVRLPQSSPKWRQRYARLFAEGDGFLAEGPHMGRCLAELGCPPEKIHVQHLGVDVDRIAFVERRQTTGQPVRILMAATFREKKGIPYAIEALARVASRFPTAELRLLGGAHTPAESQMMAYCKQLANDRGIAERVHFLGALTYANYLNEIASAHLFMAPSVHASDGDTEGGAPVALIEAAAAGMPAVATRHCDIPEVVIDGKTGFLVAERDIVGLADALAEMLSAPERWPEIGRAARAHVEREFDMMTQARRLESIYREVIRNHA